MPRRSDGARLCDHHPRVLLNARGRCSECGDTGRDPVVDGLALVAFVVMMLLAAVLLACGPSSPESCAVDSTSSGSSTSSTTSTSSGSSTTPASTSSSTTSTTSGSSDDGSTSTSSGSSSDGDSTSSDGSSTTSSCTPVPYGACEVDDDCCDGTCQAYAGGLGDVGHACASACDGDDDCPPVAAASGTPQCVAGRCALACSDDADCLPGASCIVLYCGFPEA